MPRKSEGQMHAFKVLRVHARGVGPVDHLCGYKHTHQTKIILSSVAEICMEKLCWGSTAKDH